MLMRLHKNVKHPGNMHWPLEKCYNYPIVVHLPVDVKEYTVETDK